MWPLTVTGGIACGNTRFGCQNDPAAADHMSRVPHLTFAALYDALTAAGIEVRVVYSDGTHSIVLIDHPAVRSLCAATPITEGRRLVCGDWPELTALAEKLVASAAQVRP